MAQRATKFAKKTSRHVEVGALARASASSSSEDMRSVPLDLMPLLQPFKKRGRLTVRVEKLPIQARLSAGRNNGDRSYSLMMDELEDLEYLAPEGTEPRPVLSVRVISLDDGDASTIAVKDVVVEFGEEENFGEIDLANISNEDLRRLIEELTRVKSTLSLREAELNEIRSKPAANGKLPPGTLEAELAEARAAWKVEMDEKIAKVKAEAAANLERSWSAWQAEQAKKSGAADFEKERIRWQQDSVAAIAKAEREWKLAEERRFAAAEAKWHEHTEDQVEKTRASSKAVRDHGDQIELRRLRDELLSMQNLLAERDAEIAQARVSGGKAAAPGKQDVEAAIAKAQKEWKEAEAARLAAAEARWKERAEKAVADVQTQSKSGRDQSEGELRRLREELATAQAKLANREKELAQSHSTAKSGREQIDAELRRLRDEASTLQIKLAERDKELAQAHTVAKSARDQGEAELRRVRDQASALQVKLIEREKELVQAQVAIREAQDGERRNADIALTKAEQSWKARESERSATAQSQWQEKTAKAIAEAHAQAKAELAKERERWKAEADATLAKAEAVWKAREVERLAAAESQWQQKSSGALSDARAQVQAARDQGELELTRLRTELTIAQTKLSERNASLTEARATIERVREEGKAALINAEKAWRTEENARAAAVEKRMREQSGSALTEAEMARKEAETELRTLREHAAIVETTLADRELELTQAIARINATERQLDDLRENEDIQVRRVKGELTALEQQIAERDEELAQARLFAERSYERWQKQSEAELAKAQKAWKSAEASRLAAARAEWQEESRKALHDSLDAERRSGRLPPVRAPEEAVSVDIAGVVEDRPMPVFAPPPQNAPFTPPPVPRAAIADARNAADEALERLAMDAYQLLASANSIDAVSPTDTKIIKGGFIERRENRGEKNDKTTWIMAAAAAGVAALIAVGALFLWPSSDSSAPASQVVAKAAPVQPKPTVLPKATMLKSMNMRSGPSTSDTIVTTLKVGDQVTPGERSGNWMHISVDAGAGKPTLQGWVLANSVQLPVAAESAVAEPETPKTEETAPAETESQAAPEAQKAEIPASEPATAPAPEPVAQPEQSQASAPETQAAPAPAPEAQPAATVPAPEASTAPASTPAQ
ncbi:MAG TPA: SH3 domain-containing protein [Rhizomicrobium sp.]|nr:SH3 domain-containing protein [Rhizomicrobium sp.]